MDTVLATVDKSATEEIRIALSAFKGKQVLDIRVFYQDETGVWKPTRKGICILAERWLELRDAIVQADMALRQHGTV